MSNYREIVTKTIIGKGRKTFSNNYSLKTEQEPNTILGCWIINHKFSGTNQKNEIKVNGSFDLNVWYSYDNDSKTSVSTQTFTYDELMRLKIQNQDDINNTNEIIVRSLRQPTVQDVKINNGIVDVKIEKELGVEIVGESKVKIATEDDELPWDDVYDEQENTNNKIDDLNESYLQDNRNN